MSCVYGDVSNNIFSRVSTYNNKDASDLERRISDLFETLSEKFTSEKPSFEDHLNAVLVLGATGVALHEVGCPAEFALAPYSIAVIDAAKHYWDSLPQDNPY
ncbi:MAG: hypothetical protein KAJ24_05350, partial [Candidatus Aenigmarchaeota archaeon]|nr:hypothetical protein [Candidatus Aenigmarchaeota archaeon]